MDSSLTEARQRLAQRWLRRHARRLARALAEVPSGTDPEAIHQVRVACRRLRAGFRVFEEIIGTQLAARWRRRIRQLARALSDARDLDVEIVATTEQLTRIADVQIVPGVAYWLARLERKRMKSHSRVCRAVRRFEKAGVVREILRWARRGRARAVADGSGENIFVSNEMPTLTEIQQDILIKRLRDFQAAAKALDDPEDQEGHHVFRVMAKKFRYSLEALLPALGTACEVALEALRQVQSFAGSVHDYDVWSSRLEQTRKAVTEGGRIRPRWLNPRRLEPGLSYLINFYRDARSAIFKQLVDFYRQEKLLKLWKQLEETGFLERQAASVQVHDRQIQSERAPLPASEASPLDSP